MITTYDVRWACDVMRPGVRRVGRRRRPGLHRGRPAAGPRHRRRPSPRPRQLWWLVDRPNLFIKIPATEAGLPAITATLAEGISVNVTLIFCLDRYDAGHGRVPGRPGAGQGERPRPVQDRLGGVVLRVPGGHRGRQAAREDRHRRGQGAAGQGGHRQRPARLPALRARSSAPTAGRRWPTPARTRSVRCGRRPSTKNPDYRDVMYVEELIAPGMVNTMPEPTIHAFADHGEVTRRHGHRRVRRGPARCSTTSPRSASTTTTWSRRWSARASRSSRRAGSSCSNSVETQLGGAR